MSKPIQPTASPITGATRWSRRQFLKTSAGLGLSAAGMALLGGCAAPSASSGAGQEKLETSKVMLGKAYSICLAPAYLAEDLLKEEGFTDVQYVEDPDRALVAQSPSGEQINFSMELSTQLVTWLDAQNPILILAGVHVGCFELFGNGNIHTILDLKGKTIGIADLGGSDHAFLVSMATYVGLDPTKDIHWVIPANPEDVKRLFVEHKVDACILYPPDVQELRAKKIGQVVVNSMMDQPWSHYFCCMIAGNRDFVNKNPVATKRVVRSILKAADICALQPERAARYMVDKGYAQNYDYALEAMQEMPYNRWREYDPSDTLRFYALRLHEAGMVKASPDEIIARGADWSFLNQIKQETKS